MYLYMVDVVPLSLSSLAVVWNRELTDFVCVCLGRCVFYVSSTLGDTSADPENSGGGGGWRDPVNFIF